MHPADITRAATARVPGVANTCGADSVVRAPGAAAGPNGLPAESGGRQLLSPKPDSPRPKPTTMPVTGACVSLACTRSSTWRPATAPSRRVDSIRGGAAVT